MLTTQQDEAFSKAYQILSEQFDGVLIVVMTDLNEDTPKEATRAAWYGGRVQAMGLCEEARTRLREMGEESH